ncbi:MAG TPA: hypothetical protein QGG47_05225 [Acidobacteriota bacterium]|nr:hypothetical protein [Acidobacteriota bacterium]
MRVPLLALASLLTLATAADASVIRGLTLKDLRWRAESIAAGTVVGVRTVRTATSIETVARVRVDRAFKGIDSRTLSVRVPGGIHAGRRLVVEGSPEFREGERVLLFLYRDGDGWRPVGMFQGVWRLDRDDLKVARASRSGGALILAPAAGRAAVELRERTVSQLVGDAGVAR